MKVGRSAIVLAKGFALSGLLVSIGQAQVPSGHSPGPPSPETIAKARAYADTLIAAANAGDVFENITTGDHPILRHRPSGMECNFNETPGERVWIVPSSLPRGDDIDCASDWQGFTTSMYLTRFPKPMTTDEASAMYIAQLKKAHPEAVPYTGKGAAVRTREGQPLPCQTAKFVLTLNGQSVFSRLSVAVVNGWVVEERISGPLNNPMMGDVLGESEMFMALESLKTR